MNPATKLPDMPPPLTPAPGIGVRGAYGVPRPATPISIFLDGNEGLVSPGVAALLQGADAELIRRYPKDDQLTRLLAERHGVDASRVIVTAGADDALYRACRAVLSPTRRLILPVPSFEMLVRDAELCLAPVESIPWRPGPFPIDAVTRALKASEQTAGAVAVVTPNNPTGSVATESDLRRVVEAAAPRGTLTIVDLAYTEFAERDLTPLALTLPSTLVVRTLSKAWGLAGLRVGYAIVPENQPELAMWMRAASGPYPCAGLALALAEQRLRTGEAEVQAFVARVRAERAELAGLLGANGVRVDAGEGNFVFAQCASAAEAQRLWEHLAQRGIAVRRFPGKPGLDHALRITCPGHSEWFRALVIAVSEFH